MGRARNWREVRDEALKSGHVTEAGLAAARHVHDDHARAYRLRQLREAHNLNQTEVAETMKVTQSRVSRLERGDITHTEVGTLRSYVEALGGELRIIADFGDEQLAVG